MFSPSITHLEHMCHPKGKQTGYSCGEAVESSGSIILGNKEMNQQNCWGDSFVDRAHQQVPSLLAVPRWFSGDIQLGSAFQETPGMAPPSLHSLYITAIIMAAARKDFFLWSNSRNQS